MSKVTQLVAELELRSCGSSISCLISYYCTYHALFMFPCPPSMWELSSLRAGIPLHIFLFL